MFLAKSKEQDAIEITGEAGNIKASSLVVDILVTLTLVAVSLLIFYTVQS